MQPAPPKYLSPDSVYLKKPGTDDVVRDTKGYGVKAPSIFSQGVSVAWHVVEAVAMSGGGFAIYGSVKAGYSASAMAAHNWMLEADGQEPLKPGSPEYIATEAVYQGLGDLVGSSVAGMAHGIFGVISAALRPKFNSCIEWLTTRGGGTEQEIEQRASRHFVLTVANPALRVPLDNIVSLGFGLNSLSSTYRSGTGDVDPSVLPGKAPAEGTYFPFDLDSAATRNALVGLGAMSLGLMYVALKDGHLMWAAPAPLTKEGAGLAMASRHRAGYEMATSGIAGSKVPVFAAQGMLSALLGAMKAQGASEQQLAIANSALNGLLHFQRVAHWGHARRESELVGNYTGLIAQAQGPAQRDSLVRESKVADTLRAEQFQADPWLQETMKAGLPVLISFFAAAAAKGVLQEPYAMTSSSDWSTQGGPLSSINIQEALTGMGIGLATNQLFGQLLPEPIPVPTPAPDAPQAPGPQPQGPATASKARKDIVSFSGALSGGAIAGFTGGPGHVLGSAIIALTHRISVLPKNPAHSVMAHVGSLVQSVVTLFQPSTQMPQGRYQPIPLAPEGPEIEVLPDPVVDEPDEVAGQEAAPAAVVVPEAELPVALELVPLQPQIPTEPLDQQRLDPPPSPHSEGSTWSGGSERETKSIPTAASHPDPDETDVVRFHTSPFSQHAAVRTPQKHETKGARRELDFTISSAPKKPTTGSVRWETMTTPNRLRMNLGEANINGVPAKVTDVDLQYKLVTVEVAHENRTEWEKATPHARQTDAEGVYVFEMAKADKVLIIPRR